MDHGDHSHHATEATVVGSHDGHDHGAGDHCGGHAMVDGNQTILEWARIVWCQSCPSGSSTSYAHGLCPSFHADVTQEILFRGWETTNALELFGSAVAIFLAGALYEGLKYYREALHARATTATGDSQVNITKNECGSKGACGGAAAVKYSMLSSAHIVQTLLHIIQSTASYILMLVFMTYNVWLCMALVLGMALGYFFFGWRKSSVVDATEHCQ